MHLFSWIYRFSVKQSQGAITERLRSFSMHDLTAIQGDEPVGQGRTNLSQKQKEKVNQAPVKQQVCWFCFHVFCHNWDLESRWVPAV